MPRSLGAERDLPMHVHSNLRGVAPRKARQALGDHPVHAIALGGDLWSHLLLAGDRHRNELDSRVGYHVRSRFLWSGFRFQAAWTDNGGDRDLHSGQYSWRTRFVLAGLEARLGPDFILVAEGALEPDTRVTQDTKPRRLLDRRHA